MISSMYEFLAKLLFENSMMVLFKRFFDGGAVDQPMGKF